jgi:hypothetical protein
LSALVHPKVLCSNTGLSEQRPEIFNDLLAIPLKKLDYWLFHSSIPYSLSLLIYGGKVQSRLLNRAPVQPRPCSTAPRRMSIALSACVIPVTSLTFMPA